MMTQLNQMIQNLKTIQKLLEKQITQLEQLISLRNQPSLTDLVGREGVGLWSEKWYPGTILQVNLDGSLKIKWDNDKYISSSFPNNKFKPYTHTYTNKKTRHRLVKETSNNPIILIKEQRTLNYISFITNLDQFSLDQICQMVSDKKVDRFSFNKCFRQIIKLNGVLYGRLNYKYSQPSVKEVETMIDNIWITLSGWTWFKTQGHSTISKLNFIQAISLFTQDTLEEKLKIYHRNSNNLYLSGPDLIDFFQPIYQMILLILRHQRRCPEKLSYFNPQILALYTAEHIFLNCPITKENKISLDHFKQWLLHTPNHQHKNYLDIAIYINETTEYIPSVIDIQFEPVTGRLSYYNRFTGGLTYERPNLEIV